MDALPPPLNSQDVSETPDDRQPDTSASEHSFQKEKNAWFAVVQGEDPLPAKTAIQRLSELEGFGKKVILAVVAGFRGTAPPPPWPSPELYQSLDNVKRVREGIEVLARAKSAQFARNSKINNLILRVGGDTFDKADALWKRYQYIKGRSPGQAIAEEVGLPKSSPSLLKTAVYGTIAIAGLYGVVKLIDAVKGTTREARYLVRGVPQTEQ